MVESTKGNGQGQNKDAKNTSERCHSGSKMSTKLKVISRAEVRVLQSDNAVFPHSPVIMPYRVALPKPYL